MRRKGSLIYLLGSVIMGALAAFVAVTFLKQASETVPAVVAARDIEPYVRLSGSDFKVAEVPLASMPQDAVKDVKELEGRYARDRIFAGEVLRWSRIASVRSDRGVLSARLSEQKNPEARAFALPFDKSSAVAGKIMPGDRVDVIASVKIDAGGRSVGVGKVIAKNKLVLDVDFSGSERDRGVLVLVLTPEEIEDVAFALTSGQVRFALNPYETEEVDTAGVTGEVWLKKFGFAPEEETKEVPGK